MPVLREAPWVPAARTNGKLGKKHYEKTYNSNVTLFHDRQKADVPVKTYTARSTPWPLFRRLHPHADRGVRQ